MTGISGLSVTLTYTPATDPETKPKSTGDTRSLAVIDPSALAVPVHTAGCQSDSDGAGPGTSAISTRLPAMSCGALVTGSRDGVTTTFRYSVLDAYTTTPSS